MVAVFGMCRQPLALIMIELHPFNKSIRLPITGTNALVNAVEINSCTSAQDAGREAFWAADEYKKSIETNILPPKLRTLKFC